MRREPALLGGVALLERAVTYALGALALAGPVALHEPTPCRGWDLRALLAHLADSLTALCEASESGHVPIAAPHRTDDDPVAAVRDRATRLIGYWAEPVRDAVSIEDHSLTAGVVTSAGALEIAVHGWDVARTRTAHHPVPAALAEELLEVAPLLVSDVDRSHRFALPVAMPVEASASDRLIAYCGRDPS
ncbi:TIGR03086 family metal-binding protein [Amycolatopsis minnesotensis]|uniref:Maleylpyruvate isomerase family mycothiol-dependent enzyme n=1 Tax=Amycolatopsis minnesotensis TaxID=337894 RepID=A0ABP5D0B2_9PSEU